MCTHHLCGSEQRNGKQKRTKVAPQWTEAAAKTHFGMKQCHTVKLKALAINDLPFLEAILVS